MPQPTSKKRSASSNASPPDAAPLLFIDRCAWSRRLGEALTAAGIPFIAHHQRFAPVCPDEEWMQVAGSEGWVVLTRDQAIRRKPNELKAFRAAKLILFALASGNASAADTARLVEEPFDETLELPAVQGGVGVEAVEEFGEIENHQKSGVTTAVVMGRSSGGQSLSSRHMPSCSRIITRERASKPA